MNDCPRVGKWFRGCRFEPRYDEPARTLDNMFRNIIGVEAMTPEQIAAAEPTIRYVRDVCATCGKTIERLPAPPKPTDAKGE